MNSTTSRFIQIAGLFIKLNFQYAEMGSVRKSFERSLSQYVKNYFITYNPSKIDHTINFIWAPSAQIISTKKNNEYYIKFFKKNKINSTTVYYQISLYQFDSILRSILLDLLSRNRGILLHSSAIYFNDHAYLFWARSGGGKSTIIKLLGRKYTTIADDSICLRRINGKFFIYKTPFIEKNTILFQSNQAIELRKIFVLQKSDHVEVKKITNQQIKLKYSLQQTIAHDKKQKTKKFLKTVLQLADEFTEYYLLSFNRNKFDVLKQFKLTCT